MDRSNKLLESCVTVLDILQNDGGVRPKGHFVNLRKKLVTVVVVNSRRGIVTALRGELLLA